MTCFFFAAAHGFSPLLPAPRPRVPTHTMYDEVEIEDMDWNDELAAYTYACPCGDVFQITKVREGGGACCLCVGLS